MIFNDIVWLNKKSLAIKDLPIVIFNFQSKF